MSDLPADSSREMYFTLLCKDPSARFEEAKIGHLASLLIFGFIRLLGIFLHIG